MYYDTTNIFSIIIDIHLSKFTRRFDQLVLKNKYELIESQTFIILLHVLSEMEIDNKTVIHCKNYLFNKYNELVRIKQYWTHKGFEKTTQLPKEIMTHVSSFLFIPLPLLVKTLDV
jgi:hypothetical protein